MKVILHTNINSVVCMAPSLRTWQSGFRNQARQKYRVIRNDCRGFNNFSYTIHL